MVTQIDERDHRLRGEQLAQDSLVQQWLIVFLFSLSWQRHLRHSKAGGQRHTVECQ